MKKNFAKFLKWLIDTLLKFYNKLEVNSTTKNLPFHSLSPIKNADKDNNYYNALKWAIENRKKEDIKNIAVAGPFGSGKSSILKTFEKKNTNRDLHILNISLANFRNGELEDDKQKNDLPRLIELSILQQIFYHEKDSKIPDSRFRKIRSFKPSGLIIKTAGALVFLFAISNVFFHDKLVDLFQKLEFNFPAKEWLTISSVVFLLIGLSIIIYNSVRAIHSLRVSKFKIKNAEIEVDKDVNKSILNHHLDEIIYFFEVTKYNIVFIEDLDRFGQTEIFTKLREINLLINNSKKIKQDVVFIYAIRDDMFLDEERTKFFDFVIPIIPVINSSNSNEILLEKKRDNKFEISDNLIDNISLFIEDMRILHNIINEYYIYHLNLDKKLDQDKLLSMIVYKNMFPNDFTLLATNKGRLYETINKRKEYIKSEHNKINEQISKIESEIHALELMKIKDVKELRSLYLFRYQCKINQLSAFVINNNNVSLLDMLNDDNFNLLANNKVTQVNAFNPSFRQIRTQNIPFTFDNISDEVNENETYFEREKQIEKRNNNYINNLKKKIEGHENKKNEIKTTQIKNIVKRLYNEDEKNTKQEILINVLLRNGFIDEDYLDYISIFYEGSLSKQDHQFLLNVKAQLSSDFDYNLIKLEKLVSKINPIDFKESYILNYKILNYLLSRNDLAIQRVNIFEQLSNESKKSLGFIDGYIQNESNIPLFFENLCKFWINIWNYISSLSNFTDKKKNDYLKLILCHANISDLKKIAENSELIQVIANKADFTDFIGNDNRAKEIIENLEIKFERLDVSKTSKGLIDFIYEGYYYSLNVEILKVLIEEIGELDKNVFETSNYCAIKNSGCDELFEHLKIHINHYIQNVYLKISTNINEQELCFIELLESNEINSKNIGKLIEIVETKISDITVIENNIICDCLFEFSKVQPNWMNIIHYYELEDNEITEYNINYLNDENNASILANSKIPEDENEDDKRFWDFTLNLIRADSISDGSFAYIVKSIPYAYSSLNIEELSSKKVELLIQNFKLSMTSEIYDMLKENFDDLHITLLIRYKKYFLTTINNYDIDQDDFYILISSTMFNSNEKELILKNIDEDIVLTNEKSIAELGKLILEDYSFEVSNSLIKKILLSDYLDKQQKIKIIKTKQTQLDKDMLTVFLNSLDAPYSNIPIFGKMPLLEDNLDNKRLVEVLKTKGYISKYRFDKKGIRISTFKK